MQTMQIAARPVQVTYRKRTSVCDRNNPAHSWKQYRIEALIEGKVAGSIRIMHLDMAAFAEHFTSIWHFVAHEFGIYGLCDAAAGDDIESVLNLIDEHRDRIGIGPSPTWLTDTRNRYRFALHQVEVAHRQSFEMFAARFVDRPYVGSVVVRTAYQRRGIGTALCMEAARWMQHRGYHLHTAPYPTPEGAILEASIRRRFETRTISLSDGPISYVRA
jgi:GNAT superfamily N-acetyltransferase